MIPLQTQVELSSNLILDKVAHFILILSLLKSVKMTK